MAGFKEAQIPKGRLLACSVGLEETVERAGKIPVIPFAFTVTTTWHQRNGGSHSVSDCIPLACLIHQT